MPFLVLGAPSTICVLLPLALMSDDFFCTRCNVRLTRNSFAARSMSLHLSAHSSPNRSPVKKSSSIAKPSLSFRAASIIARCSSGLKTIISFSSFEGNTTPSETLTDRILLITACCKASCSILYMLRMVFGLRPPLPSILPFMRFSLKNTCNWLVVSFCSCKPPIKGETCRSTYA